MRIVDIRNVESLLSNVVAEKYQQLTAVECPNSAFRRPTRETKLIFAHAELF